MKLEDLFEDESLSFCDCVWLISLLLLPSSSNKANITINLYINENKVGEK